MTLYDRTHFRVFNLKISRGSFYGTVFSRCGFRGCLKSQGKFFWSDGRMVGQGQSQGKFFWSDGRTIGRGTDESFYFALEPPVYLRGPNFLTKNYPQKNYTAVGWGVKRVFYVMKLLRRRL